MTGKLSYARFSRPFAVPFLYGSQTLTSREGFLLRRETENGIYFSEAAPLPGHSIESLEQVAHALNDFSPDIESNPSSLRFALEGLRAQESPGKNPVFSNGLVRFHDPEHARAEIAALTRRGYSVCKLKISSDAWKILFEVLEEFPSMRFRLDANQRLNPEQLEDFFGFAEKSPALPRVEYLEEPFAGVWDKKEFSKRAVRLAADESAPDPERALELLTRMNPPQVFIVKPSVAGGLYSIEGFLRKMEHEEREVVITSSLESESGRRALLAWLSGRKAGVCGLSTGALYRENYLADLPVYREIPQPTETELAVLNALSWRELS